MSLMRLYGFKSLTRPASASVAIRQFRTVAARAADADAKVGATAVAKSDSGAAPEGRRQRKLVSREDWETEAASKLRYGTARGEHDTVIAGGTESGKRLRAAGLYKLYNTPLAKALRPEQSESIENLHLIRLAKLRAFMGTYKQREKWKKMYAQRPIRVSFVPPSANGEAPRAVDPRDQWIQSVLAQYQRDLSRSTSPWPVGKQEQFLTTARRALFNNFNHSKLTKFAQLRPLPPTHQMLAAKRAAARVGGQPQLAGV